jgi:recombinational DNA repair protein (RecF pathway)
MKCFVCQKQLKTNGIRINADGDFVCSPKCKKQYEKDKNYFFSNIVSSKQKTLEYLLGKKYCIGYNNVTLLSGSIR